MTQISMGQIRPELGFWLESPNPAVCEIAADLGYTIALLDAEHGVFDASSRANIVLLGRSLGLRVLFRAAAPDRLSIHQALDAGADGVVIPQLMGLAHAREITGLTKYPPLGRRGYGGGRTVHYLEIPDRFVEAENRRVQCYAMIETAEAIAEIDAIAGLPTVDGLFVGPHDLALARGRGPYLADGRDHDDFACIAAAAQSSGKPWAITLGSKLDREFCSSLGAEFLIITDDVTALRRGLAGIIEDALSD